ncbi:hypothetical protein [Aeromicrobium sp. CTD01-1L150]|uniref:hypothetical protein n=1 Tax=Aeromicrobium sp. CTD01-1L150 TaxID=3341830 RepID=UPI0035C00CD2
MTRASMVNVALGVVLLALLSWLVLFAFRGVGAVPVTTSAERTAQEHTEITRAARAGTLAFLTTDHTRMDELTDEVLDHATGEFKEQYEASVDSLKEAATSEESYSKGSVEEVGLGEVTDDSASAFVAAGSEVRNKGTKGETENRSWRMKLTMTKEDGRWLISQLEFVG